MTTAKTYLQPIFATPFASVRLDVHEQLNRDLVALFSQRATAANRDPDSPADSLSFRSREDIFEWDHEALRLLKREILAAVCAPVMAVNIYSDAQFRELRMAARARFALVRGDGHLSRTSGSAASWSAIYCVTAPPAAPPEGAEHQRLDSGTLRLYDSRQGMYLDAANTWLRKPFGIFHHIWRPIPGYMAVFPGAIPYELALNRDQDDVVLVIARIRFASPVMETLWPW